MKKVYFIFIFLFIVLLIVLLRRNPPVQKASPVQPSPVYQGSWNGIQPGRTTQEQLFVSAGPPVSTDSFLSETVYAYKSGSPYWTNSVFVRGKIVTFVRERLFPPSETSYVKRTMIIGGDPVRLYGESFSPNIFLYAFLEYGVALVANKESDIVYEAWYFSPIPLSSFLSLPQVRGYSQSPKHAGSR